VDAGLFAGIVPNAWFDEADSSETLVLASDSGGVGLHSSLKKSELGSANEVSNGLVDNATDRC